MPTSRPRHSITETPEVEAALRPLRELLGDDVPSLAQLVVRGAEVELREQQARDRARQVELATFVDRLVAGPQPDLEEAYAIRHATRLP